MSPQNSSGPRCNWCQEVFPNRLAESAGVEQFRKDRDRAIKRARELDSRFRGISAAAILHAVSQRCLPDWDLVESTARHFQFTLDGEQVDLKIAELQPKAMAALERYCTLADNLKPENARALMLAWKRYREADDLLKAEYAKKEQLWKAEEKLWEEERRRADKGHASA